MLRVKGTRKLSFQLGFFIVSSLTITPKCSVVPFHLFSSLTAAKNKALRAECSHFSNSL